MWIQYASDGEQTGTMLLDDLIANFNENGGWQFGHNETDMRDAMTGRGWYEGVHEYGHYLVLNLDMLQLQAIPGRVRLRSFHRSGLGEE